LSRLGPQLFKDEDFAGLYREEHGRPSVPPSQLCVALLLQTHDGVSDEEAIERTAYDLRWKVALGLELREKLCAKSTLQLFRAKPVVHEQYGQIFEASVPARRAAQAPQARRGDRHDPGAGARGSQRYLQFDFGSDPHAGQRRLRAQGMGP
jgi:hypothetical protein